MVLEDKNGAPDLIEAAHDELKRPVWIWLMRPEAGASSAPIMGVFQCDGDHDPELVTPIRIAWSGGHYFALAELDNDSEVTVELEQLDVQESLGHASLPDLKEDVDRHLADAAAQIDDIETWSRKSLAEPYDLSASKQPVQDLRAQLTNGKGKDAAFLGTNGIGKSTIQNLLILNSSIDEATYKSRPVQYVTEALLNIWPPSKEDAPPTFEKLLVDPKSIDGLGVEVVLLKPETSLLPSPSSSNSTTPTVSQAEILAEFAETEASIKRYCEQAGDKPELKRFVLPVGEGGKSTTSLHTRVSYGAVVHLLVEHYSVEELQKQAFKFVQLLIDLDGENPKDLPKAEKDSLIEAWYVYLNVKHGPYKRGNLPRIGQMPKHDTGGVESRWQDVKVGAAMLEIISSPIRLYLGTGTSLHLDRAMAHDYVKRMNDKELLYRYAIKAIENFQPAAVLEGGNAFVDLPGQNDVDTGCSAQTREGVKQAGVVFVVLAKSLYEDENSLRLLQDSDTIKRAAAGEANVVFLFNREPLTGYKHRQLDTQAEVKVRKELEESTRELWKKELLEANDDADERKTDAEIEQLAADTPMRTIYPMLHSSLKLNWQFAESHKQTEGDLCGSERTFELSNVNWLLGILETLNRNARIDQLKHVATKTLPELHQKLQSRMEEARVAKKR